MKSLLHIIPYEFYPPIGGGQLRCFYFLKAMSRQYKVVVLTVISSIDFKKLLVKEFPVNVEFIEMSERTKYSNIASKINSKIGDRINYSFLTKTIFEKTNTFFLQSYLPLIDVISKSDFDFVFYENLEVVSLFSKIINQFQPRAIKVYDAHNVDSELWLSKAKFEKNVDYFNYSEKALKIEKSLFNKIDYFVCCSEIDKNKIIALNKYRIQGFVLPNGVDISKNVFHDSSQKNTNKILIFCGSLDYFPNKEGLKWFYFHIFPLIKKRIPDIKLNVIGKVSDYSFYNFLVDDISVSVIGNVESVIPYYYNSSVAIVPLLSGSGTRLKILEAMSLGNPIVTTEIGCEGLDKIKSSEIIIANTPEKFAISVMNLLENSNYFEDIRLSAAVCVSSNYDWENIGSQLLNILKSKV